jgi:hypothetical protein
MTDEPSCDLRSLSTLRPAELSVSAPNVFLVSALSKDGGLGALTCLKRGLNWRIFDFSHITEVR